MIYRYQLQTVIDVTELENYLENICYMFLNSEMEGNDFYLPLQAQRNILRFRTACG